MKRLWIEEVLQYKGKEAHFLGWVANRRDHGKIIFVDLRDKTGVVQLVFTPNHKEVYAQAEKLRSEWVIGVTGIVNSRPEAMINPKISTGELEIEVTDLEIISPAKIIPFEIETEGREISEELRLKYRYLDLRRSRMQQNLINRFKTTSFIRNYLASYGFIEVETPYLTKSTPEGARDFVVPSRLDPGRFYALPQSPQQYKQLLMVGGIERYFQVVRCFRDEDSRGDRQPEFTQLDIEMDFIEEEDILGLIEKMLKELIEKFFPNKKITQYPFIRLNYNEAISQYCSDRPDLRQNKNDSDELAFAFVVNFPLFEWKEGEKRWDAVHHPFTRPQFLPQETLPELITRIKQAPHTIMAHQYDVVLNGYEIGGGSLRISEPELLEAVFELLGHSPETINQQFGHLLEAFDFGVPPHGGIALGLDRVLMILLNEPSIREVIAFPKTGDGRDLMIKAPAEIDEKQLRELRLKIIKDN
ncbi:MAG: aspartate--tRNA ligase [Candidatus Pacebacteria bacterium]|nr:aspartate--tRNA ligase [Candidatus Paceibacterota bacterium]